ncbi:MAG: NAD(P)/FAD-dependent oxidoreductase [Polyangiales bacterium]
MPADPDVIVLGAGPAGLAAAACLSARGLSHVIVERAPTVGSRWRSHYERLHLHTAKQLSALPMMPWPREVSNYPSRAQVVDYLEAYAQRFKLAPRFGLTAHDAHRDGDRWIVPTREGDTLRARALVVATGYNRAPHTPTFEGRDRFAGEVLHSGEYRNGNAYRGKRALVVGVGNSGAEIALDLWESGATTALSARSPQHVLPRDVFGIPAQVNSVLFLSRMPTRVADRFALAVSDRFIGDLSRYGLPRPELGPISLLKRGRVPLMDIGTVALIKQGHVKVYPGPARFTEDGVTFTDGRSAPFDVVVLATGYRAALDEVLRDASAVVDERGFPKVFGAEAAPGLYFIGYRNPITGQLHDIALEAERVAAHLAGN